MRVRRVVRPSLPCFCFLSVSVLDASLPLARLDTRFFFSLVCTICAFSSKTSTTHPHTPHFFALEKAEAQVVQHHGKRGFTFLVKGWCCSVSSVQQPASCSSILSATARSAVVRHLRLSAWSPFV